MPATATARQTRLGKLISAAAADGRITVAEVEGFKAEALANKVVSSRERAELRRALAAHKDKFETAARGRLWQFTTHPKAVDLADPSILKKHEGQVVWSPVVDGKLFVDGVSYDDVVQGAIANCYLPAALSAVAYHDPKLIENAIRQNADGTFTVRFHERQWFGSARTKVVEVTVDGDVPMAEGADKARYGRGRDRRELWTSVIEKAYAQWKGGYEAIGNGGVSGEVISALTGRSSSSQTVQHRNPDDLFRTLQQAGQQRRPMTASTHGKDSGVDYNGTGVYAWHAYTLLGAVEEKGVRYVQLRNPWGMSEPVGDGKDDGIFRMKLEDFQRLYQSVSIG